MVEEISVEVVEAMVAAAQHASFLAEASWRLASSLDYEATLHEIPRLAVPALADWCAVDILDEHASIRRVASAHVNPAKQAIGDKLAQRYPPDPTAPYDVPQVLRTESAVINQVTEALLIARARDGEQLKLLREFGVRSEMIVPLLARGRTLGALTLATADSGRRYRERDPLLAQEFAARCALALDNARLYLVARDAIQLRDRFLASVTHDLKTPLATISGQAQLLRRVAARQEPGEGAAPAQDGLARIEATVERMARMIDELLDVARLELGQPLQLERRPMDLVALARLVTSEHQQQTSHIIQVAGEPELIGEWDPQRLQRVLDNLLSNAIKYSPEGGMITVAIARDEDDASSGAILSVRDQGVGIPEADLPRIFEAFQRAQNVSRIGGSGIGLAVARQIVAQHGGTLTADSREGYGSTFTVRLPLQENATA